MTQTINSTKEIPFHYFGGNGELFHFAHANGFPPLAYQELLKSFTENYKVIGIKHRPLWQTEPNNSVNWQTLADDLVQFLDSQNAKNIIGIGHSMGAVATLLAAAERPDFFRKIILIEPVFMVAHWAFFFRNLPKFIKNKMNPMIKGALRRRDQWEDKNEVFESWRKKRVFSKVSDAGLQNLVDAAIIPNENGGVTLAYSKYWEAHFYGLIPSHVWREMKKVKIPVLGIRGEKTNTLFPNAWKQWQELMPQGKFLEIENAGHLVPMEEPKLLSEEILKFIQD